MKKLLTILLFCTASLLAQEKKYQSLLWEVSGNGLTKKSYLYGSMHVSDKVSYHLSDAFFTHLLSADIIANESEPSTWTDLFGMFNTDYSQYQKFYSKFYLQPVKRENLYPLFQNNNYTLNNFLFRTNEYQKEYQEDTYLDMFIYRTGKKYNKKTVGLEDTKTSILGIMTADLGNNRPKEENIVAIQKILKNNGYEEALMNFYRDKDLDMIDSLTSLSTSEGYLKALLYDRNVIMVKSIDSLVRRGSLFAAVGAAHLPGQKGIIEMLRAKGYKVAPVFDSYTDKGKAKKQQIEEYFVKPEYKTRATTDGIIELLLHPSIIENNEDLESPDLANGGYINVKRLLLKDYLKGDNKPFDYRSLDSLFYENIPGKIIDKKFYNQDGYAVYDIKNITKTGNSQRYRYYKSPLEIIAINMSGEGDYVRKFEEEVFSNIKLKPVTAGWKTISPSRGGFAVELPEYAIIYGDRIKGATVPDIEIHSFDSNEQANYFVLERTLENNDVLENSKFELQRIHYEFYTQIDVDSTNTKFTEKPFAFISSSKIGNKVIHLKSIIKGSKYFLLGSVGASDKNTERFFESFALQPYWHDNEFKTFTDTTALFSVEVPKSVNEKLDFISKKQKSWYGESEKVNLFQNKYNTHVFTLASGQTVNLSFYQYHRYEDKKPLDTLWRNFRHMVTGYDPEQKNDESADVASGAIELYHHSTPRTVPLASTWENYMEPDVRNNKIISEKISYNKEEDYHQIDLLAVNSQSEQAIKYRGVYKDGRTYTINTIVEKGYNGSNGELERIFNSLKFTDDPKHVDLPDDRLELFIDDVSSGYDSIRYSALASVNEIKIQKNNVARLIGFIQSTSFKPAETGALASLYKKMGYVDDAAVVPFLAGQYKQHKSSTNLQFAILNALASQRSKPAYKMIMELLEYDLPLSDGETEVSSLFRHFEYDVKHSEALFPDVFQFYSIPEYHEAIISFTSALLNNNSIRPKKLEAYKKMILTNAKLELKRVKSRITTREADEDMYYGNWPQGEKLSGYLNLLYPYRNDKAVKALFLDVHNLGLKEINIEVARLGIVHKDISAGEVEKLLDDPQTLFPVNNMLLLAKQPQYSGKVDDEAIAASALITIGKLNTAKDSIAFIEHRAIKHNNHTIGFYFFRIVSLRPDEYRPQPDRLGTVAFVFSDNNKIDPLAFKFIEPTRIPDEVEMEMAIETIIDETLNEDRLRASFGKNPYDSEEVYVEEYRDY